MIYDCCLLLNEIDLLEMRFRILEDVVDKFVVVEGDRTFSGIQKHYNFTANALRFDRWIDRITYVPIKLPALGGAWDREYMSRDALVRGAEMAGPDDCVIYADVDEIPSPEAIKKAIHWEGVNAFDMRLYWYYLNVQSNFANGHWKCATMAKKKNLRKTPNKTRIEGGFDNVIVNGGWHFSYLGNPDQIRYKIESYSHQETNTVEVKANVEERRADLEDLFPHLEDRKGTQYKVCKIDPSYPQYVRDSIAKLERMGWIRR